MEQLQRTLIIAFISLSAIGLASFANSNSDFSAINKSAHGADFALQIENNVEMETLIKENKRCIRCHKVKRKLKNIPAMKMQGAHASTKFYDNCTACHGDKGKHPKGDSTVIDFSSLSTTPLLEQNGQCIACHTPTELRQAEWTHDVHYKKTRCASCHQLHDSVDPIINIKRTARIKLCVDCHASANKPKGEQ